MKLDRRAVLIGGGAGIGLVVAFALWSRHMSTDLATGQGEAAFGNFIKVARNGQVTVAVPQVETGQGIWTALAQIVADELGAAWDSIAVEPAPLTGAYANPLVGNGTMRITANSTSVRVFETPLRHAAATARAMLIAAAADRWNVDPGDCEAADGLVMNRGRSFTFGELAEEAASRSAPHDPPLRKAGRGRVMGQPLPRLDGPAKADGSWRFAADVRLPEMLYASARLAPPGGRLRTFSRGAIAPTLGVRHVSARDNWIAVVADTWWAAEQAVEAAAPKFSGFASATDVRPVLETALATGEAQPGFSRGDYEAAVRGSKALAATYYVAPSQHLGLEPLSATARINGGKVELWAASQAPELVSGDDSSFYPMSPGEPAGRSMEADAAPIAVELARRWKRPIQVTLSQSASQNNDRASGGALAKMMALPGTGGITAAWKMRFAAADGFGAALARLSGHDVPDQLGDTGLDGSVPPYSIPNVAIEGVLADVPFKPGYMRGSPQREFAFFTESFIDELAHAAGIEPLSFRMAMLGGNGRLARCLQGAARLAQWGGGGPGSTMGLAGVSAFGSHIGLVASATLGSDQRVKVERLVAAVDCGRVVNSGLVRQQVEAAMIWGLAQATVASPEWVAGVPRARPIGLALPRLADTPQIVVQIVASSEVPGGVSGLGATVVAPAIANAIYAATRRRMRALPFDPMAVA